MIVYITDANKVLHKVLDLENIYNGKVKFATRNTPINKLQPFKFYVTPESGQGFTEVWVE